jgi:hypothetical protein
MDKDERKPHFSIIDPLIDAADPLWAEYFRGYHRGIVTQVFGFSDATIEEHRMLMDHSGGGSGDPYIDSYARGYSHGFEGRTPESPPSSSFPSKPLLIASIV